MTSARNAGGLPIGLIEHCTPIPVRLYGGVRTGATIRRLEANRVLYNRASLAGR
jgi:hypothetical protein